MGDPSVEIGMRAGQPRVDDADIGVISPEGLRKGGGSPLDDVGGYGGPARVKQGPYDPVRFHVQDCGEARQVSRCVGGQAGGVDPRENLARRASQVPYLIGQTFIVCHKPDEYGNRELLLRGYALRRRYRVRNAAEQDRRVDLSPVGFHVHAGKGCQPEKNADKKKEMSRTGVEMQKSTFRVRHIVRALDAPS